MSARPSTPAPGHAIPDTVTATYGPPCPVHFIGVSDTAASLGYIYRNRRFFNARLEDFPKSGRTPPKLRAFMLDPN